MTSPWQEKKRRNVVEVKYKREDRKGERTGKRREKIVGKGRREEGVGGEGRREWKGRKRERKRDGAMRRRGGIGKENSSLKTKFRVQNRSKERGSPKKVILTSRIKYYSVVREEVFLG